MNIEGMEMRYWKIFNTAARIGGVLFILVGIVFGIDQTLVFIELISREEGSLKITPGVISVSLLTIGILLVKVKAYYPKHLREKLPPHNNC